jgi:nitrite reductase/ring-hydroxylating ferredoxin subunit
MKAEQNELITRIGPGTPCGDLMRRYWQPVALVDEFNPALDPAMGVRPVKAVRLLGQDLVLFKNADGSFGLLDRDCPHRGADLAFGRNEGDGLRCPFHGWKFDAAGRCPTPRPSPRAARCASASSSAATRCWRRPACCSAGAPKTCRPRPSPRSTALPRRPRTALPSRACGTATGCRPLRWASTRRMRPSCTASSSTSRWKKATAASSAAPAWASSTASACP